MKSIKTIKKIERTFLPFNMGEYKYKILFKINLFGYRLAISKKYWDGIVPEDAIITSASVHFRK